MEEQVAGSRLCDIHIYIYIHTHIYIYIFKAHDQAKQVARFHRPICSFIGKIVKCNIISIYWPLLINKCNQIYRANVVLSDTHQKYTLANRCQSSQSSMITFQFFFTLQLHGCQLKCLYIVSRYHTVYSQVTQKIIFKTRQVKELTKPQRIFKLLFNTS